MSDDATGDDIYSVGGHDEDDFLLVGVADPDSAVARELARRFGDAVSIFNDEPLERASVSPTSMSEGYPDSPTDSR